MTHSYFALTQLGSESTLISTDIAVVITFVVTALIILIVGVATGSLATNCIMKRRIPVQQQQHQVDGTKTGPLYEEVSQSKEIQLKMEENVAYGHIKQ